MRVRKGRNLPSTPRSGNVISKGALVAIAARQRSMTFGSSTGSWTDCQPQPSISASVEPVYSYYRRLYQSLWPRARRSSTTLGCARPAHGSRGCCNEGTCRSFEREDPESTCALGDCAYIAACPNRTCLWSCVGGWCSGQEAGEPTLIAGSRSEPVNPAKRGTRLKATTDRAFSSLSASTADLPKRLVSLAGRADRGAHPISNRWLRSFSTGSSPRGVTNPRRSI